MNVKLCRALYDLATGITCFFVTGSRLISDAIKTVDIESATRFHMISKHGLGMMKVLESRLPKRDGILRCCAIRMCFGVMARYICCTMEMILDDMGSGWLYWMDIANEGEQRLSRAGDK
jgi:hypothetical protein